MSSPNSTRQAIKVITITILFLVMAVYSGLKLKNVLLGPQIIIDSPVSGSTHRTPLVTISGQAKRIAKIYFNDRKIFTDENGVFNESLLLARGYNILEFKAEDSFGRKISKNVELVFQ
ncbi:MAG: hypothetical protein WCW56_01380 [Candidatus Paceibacterota bacterium]|jgi:hypothetical protein